MNEFFIMMDLGENNSIFSNCFVNEPKSGLLFFCNYDTDFALLTIYRTLGRFNCGEL
jgi:hypothetical protein